MVFLGRKDFIPKKKAHTHRLCLLGRLIENIINHVWLLLNARFQIVRVVISESLPFDQYHNRQSNGNEKEKNSRQDNTLQSWSLSVISYRMCDLWFGCVVGTITMFFIFCFLFLHENGCEESGFCIGRPSQLGYWFWQFQFSFSVSIVCDTLVVVFNIFHSLT